MPYKDALEERLRELQEEYSRTKYNKATDKHLGLLRARMAKLRREIEERSKKRKGIGFAVKKEGDATVVLVGFPKAGKSSLLNALTGTAYSKVADYAFTTLDVIPGMLEYEGAKIQLLDLPGIIEGAHLGKGGGTKVASVMRTADLLLIVVDSTAISQIPVLLEELSKLNISINKERPSVVVEKTSKGGIEVEGALSQSEKKEIADSLIANGMYNARVYISKQAPVEEIVEYILESKTYVKGIIVLNKIDLLKNEEVGKIKESVEKSTGLPVIPVSASSGANLELLKSEIFKSAGLIRIYLKPKDSQPDFEKPFVITSGSTIMDVAKKLNAKSAKYLKYAYVTGPSAKFANQKVGIEHVLSDKDIVTLVYEKRY